MSLRRLISSVFFIFLSIALKAQVSDDFSDGEFLLNPEWTGDTSKFEVNTSHELWLNAPPVNDVAYLSTINQAINNASWESKIRLNFNPSGSNYARFYLVSNQENLSSPLNGYFVQIGSTDDDICLYRQTGTSILKIIDGPNGVLNTSVVDVRVKVLRDSYGNWTLQVDTSGNHNFITYGTVTNTDHIQSYYSGFRCIYTSTRSDKFFFDDVIISGLPFNDGIGPTINGVQVSSSTELLINYNEPVTPASAQTVSNYFISNSIGNPLSASIHPLNSSQVILTLPVSIQPNTLYSIYIQNIQDFQFNIINDTLILFADYQPVVGDIIINEIMADPTPVVNLPEYEYVELYNSSSFPINLQGWKLKINNTIRVLPSYTLLPDSFVVLVHSNGISEYSGIPVLGIPSLPSITNSGAVISLYSPHDQLMDEVSFSISWYNNPNTDDGGYSLEKMNPLERCGENNNWAATLDINGGTPGRKNSLFTTASLEFGFKNIDILSADSIRIEFIKKLDTSTVQPSDFYISNGIGMPLLTLLENNQTVLLKLANSLSPNISYTLTVYQTLTDCNGNIPASNLQQQIMYYIPKLYDIVINELMVDENPTVMLPPTEYIELYNRNNFPVNIKGYELSVNNNTVLLPSAIIQPDSFIVFVKDVWLQEFQGIPVIGLSTWPTLTNTGATITLRDKKGKLLHSITYTDKWYKNPSKKDGGWSLEQIDVTKPCQGIYNWKASQDVKGGTPGRTNSVKSYITDTISPYVYGVGIPHQDTIYLHFREAIMPESVLPEYFTISQGLGHPLVVEITEPELKKVVLKTQNSLMPDQFYSLIISGPISDCALNVFQSDSFQIKIPTSVQSGDLVINEILFDPPNNGIDYVEVYNRSEKVVDLKDILIGTGDTITGFLENLRQIFHVSMIMLPGEYRLISTDMDVVLQYYFTKNKKAFIDVSSLPSYSNTSGTVTISDISQQVLDWLNYSDTWHFPLLNSKDGVSLERIDPHGETQMQSNWHSAAQTVGFGTPGYKNSQWVHVLPIAEQFKIKPEVFSPDQDGWDDILTIQYNLTEPGYMTTIKIFDAMGRLVKTLVNNQFIGTEGYFTWDGITNDGGKARIGIHIIWFELVDPSGIKVEFKAPCVVAGKI
ncbi:MAG: lamin tail domain-containing protein [Flavobacteriales bacterium]|nr:lamin tail domain-containing protein [Flavobacteriales bacterium]